MLSSHINIHSAGQTHRFKPGRMLYTCAGRVAYCDYMPAVNAKVFYTIDGQTHHTCTDAAGFFLIRVHSGANITVFIHENAGESVSPARYTLECVDEDQHNLCFCIAQA